MKKITSNIIIIICLIGVIYSGYHIFSWVKNLRDNAKIKEELDNSIIVKNKEYIIDFDKIKSQNSDAVAFLKVNGTNIEYIIVKGEDNDFYLNHNFLKEYNSGGWVFADSRNKFNEEDRNIIVYGHNMKDGSMFGTLKNTINSDWQNNKDNLTITLVTQMKTYKYQVFSTYTIYPEEYYLKVGFENNDRFLDFINTLKERSNHDYQVNLTKDDKILTLSSCIGDGTKRVVLHAKLIN